MIVMALFYGNDENQANMCKILLPKEDPDPSFRLVL